MASSSRSGSRSRSRPTSLNEENKKDSANGRTKQGKRTDDGWGEDPRNYMFAKKQKLYDQFDTDKQENKSNIFEGVRIYVNGYTKPSSDELRRIMQKHGGKYEMYLSKSRVTHIVATNLPNSKLHQARSMPVVRPEWVIDSVDAGKRLPHVDYLLFGNQTKLQPGLKFQPSTSSMSRSSSTASSSADLEFTRVKSMASLTDSVSGKHYEMDGNNVHVEENEKCEEKTQARGQVKTLDEENWQPDSSKSRSHSKYLEAKRSEEKVDCSKKVAVSSLGDCDKKTNQERRGSVDSSEDGSDVIYDSEEESDSSKTFNLMCFPNSSVGRSGESPLVRDVTLPNKVYRNFEDDIAQTFNKDVSLFPVEYDYNSESPRSLETNRVNELVAAGLSRKKDKPVVASPPKCTNSSPSPKKPIAFSSMPMPTAGDKHFLSEFYSNSRLHHLSTWGAEFKAYVAEIQQNKAGTFPGRERLRQAHVDSIGRLDMADALETARHSRQEKTIMHIDMDCFFVSVGLLLRPDLRGKPVAVTHSRGQGSKPDAASDAAWEKVEWHKKRDGKLKTHTSHSCDKKSEVGYDHLVPEGSSGTQTFHSMAEIASCSYEARQKGIKNGMFMGRAKSLCSDLQTIPYNFAEYNRISRILYDTVASYTHDIEAVSCDEMLLDCTGLLSDTGATALEFASLLRSEVMDKTGCPASVGIGPNILLARLATRKAKPNGQHQVVQSDAKSFIKDQDVSDLPGVGYSMTRKLTKLGVKSCGDLQAIPVSRLKAEFGPKTGESLHQFSIGQDEREVKGDKQRKSVSAEVNYGIRFTKEFEAVKFLQELAMEVQQRMSKLGVKGHCITLKLMVRRPDAPQETAKFMGHGICNTFNKSTNLPVATNDGCLIGREVIAMYKSHNVSATDVRGIGIQVQKLEPESQTGYTIRKPSLGHQSILNFAVPGKDNKTHIPATSANPCTMESSSPISTSCPPSNTASNKFAVISSAVRSREEDRPHDSSHRYKLTGQSGKPSCSRDGGTDVNHSSRPKAGGSMTLFDQVDLNALTDVSFLLSPSQINTEVLNELPEDIADEIRSDMEHRSHHNIGQHSHSTPITAQGNPPAISQSTENQPGPSSYYPALVPSTSSPSHGEVDERITDLPSMSQVDVGCFQALPKHLQMELQAAYARQQMKSSELEGKRAALVGTALGQLKSPTKDKKGKQTKSGKRRGRPPGKKKLTFSEQNTKVTPVTSKSPAVDNTDQDAEDVIILDDADADPKHTTVEEEDRPLLHQDSHHTATESGSTTNSTGDSSSVVFCGAETISDVRHLLREWLNSSPDPEEDDIGMVMDYLLSLIKAGFLEHVYCHLRFLKRRVSSLPSVDQWRECVDSITGQVQASVWDLYGCALKLL